LYAMADSSTMCGSTKPDETKGPSMPSGDNVTRKRCLHVPAQPGDGTLRSCEPDPLAETCCRGVSEGAVGRPWDFHVPCERTPTPPLFGGPERQRVGTWTRTDRKRGNGGRRRTLAQVGPRRVLLGAVPVRSQGGLGEQRSLRCDELNDRNQPWRTRRQVDRLLGTDVALLVNLRLDHRAHGTRLLRHHNVRPTLRRSGVAKRMAPARP
jgi:hypothetical protein